MADLAALSRQERERRRLNPNPWYDEQPAPIDTPNESLRATIGLPNLNAQPGDPDFDWGRYDAWRALQDDPVVQAKPLIARFDREQRRRDVALQAEQEAKLASGEIPSDGMTGEMVGQELLRSLTTPTALALAGGAAAAPFTAGASLPATAALIGAGTAGGHIAGDIAQRLQRSPEASESLGEELQAASLAGLVGGGGAGVVGGAAKGLNALRNLRGGGGVVLDVAADLAPGNLGRMARLLRRGGGGRGAAPAPVSAVADDMPLPAHISPWRSAREVPYRAGGGGLPSGNRVPAVGELEKQLIETDRLANTPFGRMSREGAFRGERTTGAPSDSPLASLTSRTNARYPAPNEGLPPETYPSRWEPPPSFVAEGSSTGMPGDVGIPGISIGSAFRQLHPSRTVPTSRSLAGLRAAPTRPPAFVDVPADFTAEALPTEIGGYIPPPALIPEVVGEGLTLPTSWQQFAENPVTQDLRRILEGLIKRPTRGLTNPTGR